MAITIDISSGRVDEGETKLLKVTPKDEDDAAIVLVTLAAVFTAPDGDETTKAIADFSLADGVYSIAFKFTSAGLWGILITVTDAFGYTEIESGTVRVHAL